MAKESGIGDRLLISGVDLSGDIQQVNEIGGGPNLLDVTGMTSGGYERIGGIREGRLTATTFFNTATSQEHAVLKTLPTTDVNIAYLHGSTLGNPAAGLVAKQVNYDGTRGNDAMFTFNVNALSNGFGIEWGNQLTAGLRSDTGATNGTGYAMDADGIPFLQLPGTSGNTATTPDAASLDITGDIDIRIRVAPDDWTPAADSALIAKYTTTGNQRSYCFYLLTTGQLNLKWTTDGSTLNSKSSTVNLSTLANGAIKWVRVTLDVDNGAAGNTVTFYTSDDGVTWTQLGATVVTAGTTSIFSGTAVLELGGITVGTASLLAGKVFEAQVLNGIAGTSVAHPVATNTTLSDATPLTWTINGTAYLSNQSYYGATFYLQVTAFTGTDATIKIQSSMDNGSTDAYTDVTGGSFTSVTTSPTVQRIATSTTQEVERYLRVVTTTSAGFTALSFSVVAVRNLSPVVF